MSKRFVAVAYPLGIFALLCLFQPAASGQINTPHTNSFLVAGANQEITWDPSGDTTSIVVLQYSTDAGRTWNFIASTGIGAGSYSWVIPVSVNSFLCKMRIVKYTDKGYKLIASTGNFSIARMWPLSFTNAVFSHRVITLSDTGKHHYNRIQFFK